MILLKEDVGGLLGVPVRAKVLSCFQIEPDEFSGDEKLFKDCGLLSKLVEDEELCDELESSEILKVEPLLKSSFDVVVQEIGVHYL